MPTFDPPLSKSMLSVFEGCKSAYLIAYFPVLFHFSPFSVLFSVSHFSKIWGGVTVRSQITNTYGIHASILFCLPELKV